eukprot:14827883-Alexandrium_andersonii.AAC.1
MKLDHDPWNPSSWAVHAGTLRRLQRPWPGRQSATASGPKHRHAKRSRPRPEQEHCNATDLRAN